MSRIIIAPDSFKGTMSSVEVCNIIELGLKNIDPSVEVTKVAIADGGEGTVEAYLFAAGGKRIEKTVTGPLFEQVNAFYGILNDGVTAVIEMAAASGLPLVGDRKDPRKTTTLGTGELMLDAVERGCRRLIVCIGGSATNDGGAGMAAALGIRLIGRDGKDIEPTGAGLEKLERIDMTGLNKRVSACEVLVAIDVTNPLYGTEGAAYIFGPQKGADPEMVKYLDNNLRHYEEILRRDTGRDVKDIPGAGAAGGLGAGLMAFLGAKASPGIHLVLDAVGFDELVKNCDLVITGEGRIDGQTLRGKVPLGVAKRSKGKPVVAIVGDIGDDLGNIYDSGITAVLSTNRKSIPFSEAKPRAKEDLLKTAETFMRVLKLGGSI